MFVINEKPTIKDLLDSILLILKNSNLKLSICADNVNLDFIEIRNYPYFIRLKSLAANNNLRLICKSYKGVFEKHMFKCKKCRLVFSLSPEKLKSGRRCPTCSRREAHQKMRCDFSEIENLAILKGGLLISKKYINDRTKLKWKCIHGHIWLATPGNIKRGSWCPFCAGQGKPTIDFYKKLAKSKKGICLSDRYLNAHTKLKWRCKSGHEWEASPNNIKRGSWCPYC